MSDKQNKRPADDQSNETTCSQLGKRIGDTSDIPDLLLKELRIEPRWHKEFLDALRSLEGIATRSEIMVTVYRQTGKIMKRAAFYRAAKTLRLLDIVSKRGKIYRLTKEQ